ncbi:MAG TPA: hypothetical protein VFY60_13815 [Pyrinomonadaceae bacterium]|nr:hypothetical protein [Pyrinomonadaceae bacterium]
MNLSPRTRLRLIGLLPLLFFLAQAVHYWRINELGHLLWMCNVGNLLLAIGLFLEKARVVRLAAIWMVPGLVVWFVYVVLPWGLSLTSILAHVGGFTVAMFVLTKYRMDRTAWLWALGWYLVVQLASRFVTPANLNVNLAHSMQSGTEQTFGSYWFFWLTLTAATAVSLWLSGLLLEKLFSTRRPVSAPVRVNQKRDEITQL